MVHYEQVIARDGFYLTFIDEFIDDFVELSLQAVLLKGLPKVMKKVLVILSEKQIIDHNFKKWVLSFFLNEHFQEGFCDMRHKFANPS